MTKPIKPSRRSSNSIAQRPAEVAQPWRRSAARSAAGRSARISSETAMLPTISVCRWPSDKLCHVGRFSGSQPSCRRAMRRRRTNQPDEQDQIRSNSAHGTGRRGDQGTSGRRGETPIARRDRRAMPPAAAAESSRSVSARLGSATSQAQQPATKTAKATSDRPAAAGDGGTSASLLARECGPRRRRIPAPNRPSKSPPARPKCAASSRARRAASPSRSPGGS